MIAFKTKADFIVYFRITTWFVAILILMLFSTVSLASTKSFIVKCNKINIQHKDDLVVITMLQNFSLEKKNEFVIKGNSAVITVDKSSINPEMTLPEDFSDLKIQVSKSDDIVALDRIKSIDVKGNILFTSRKDKIKFSATRIVSTDGAITFKIENPILKKVSNSVQDINVKANSTILDTKTKSIKLIGNCMVNVTDKSTKANISAPNLAYAYTTSKISGSGCAGWIVTNGYQVNFKAKSISYASKSSIAELSGLSLFTLKSKDVEARLSAKKINYTPTLVKASLVSNIEITSSKTDNISASSDEIVFDQIKEDLTLGKNSKVKWTNASQPPLLLISNAISVNLKTQFVKFASRSNFTFNSDYKIEANTGSFNRDTGKGVFIGNVIVNDALQSAINCDSIEFTITKDQKRIELKNLKDSKLNIKD